MLSEKLSYPDLCDKPILEVSYKGCHEMSVQNKLEKESSVLVCLFCTYVGKM